MIRIDRQVADVPSTGANSTVYQTWIEHQPIVDAIAASLRRRRLFANRDFSITLSVTEGPTLVVSVRPGSPHLEPPPEASNRGLNARQLRLVNETIHEKIAGPISVSLLSSVAGLS